MLHRCSKILILHPCSIFMNTIQTEMSASEMYDRKITYTQAQLYLGNRKFTPYPNGGGCESSICKKHAQYQQKLFAEQEARHSLWFYAEMSSIRAEEDGRLPKKEVVA